MAVDVIGLHMDEAVSRRRSVPVPGVAEHGFISGKTCAKQPANRRVQGRRHERFLDDHESERSCNIRLEQGTHKTRYLTSLFGCTAPPTPRLRQRSHQLVSDVARQFALSCLQSEPERPD